MDPKNKRVKAGFWIAPSTRNEKLPQIADELKMSSGRTIDWLVDDYLQRKNHETTLETIATGLKKIRAAINDSNTNSAVAIELINTMMCINGWQEADLFDTLSSSTRATKTAFNLVAEKREAAIKKAMYKRP